MAEEVGVGYVRLIPSLRGFKKAAERQMGSALKDPARKAGEDAGDEAAKGFQSGFSKGAGPGLGARLMARFGRKAAPVGEDVGSQFGKGFGEGFTRDAQGRVRDAQGRFVPASEQPGSDSGKGFFRGFLGGFLSSASDGSKRFAGGFRKAIAGELEISAQTVATGFSAQFVASVAAGLASGAAKATHGIAAVAALLPAAATAGVVAFASLKVAVLGVGDALEAGLAGDTEKFNEALKKLSPSARAFAREVVGMKSGLDKLKSSVQERFFAQFEGQTSRLGRTWLPILRRELSASAGSFGKTVSEAGRLLNTPKVVLQITAALRNSNVAIGNVTTGLASLLRAFLPLVTVGSTFLPRLSGGFASATDRLASFMQRAAETGKLAAWIQSGLDKLRSLWTTAQQLWAIFKNIGSIVQTSLGQVGGIFEGLGIQTGGVLDSFEQLTGKAARFVKTAEGSEAVGVVFKTLSSIVSGAMGTLQRIGQLLGRVFGPIMPQLSDLFEAIANLKIAFIDALEPALVTIGGVLGRTVVPGLTKLAELLTRNRPLLQGIGIAIATLLLPATISWAAATIAAAAPWILLGAVIAGFAALVIIHFDTIKNAVLGVFNWIKTNWPLLLAILTGPIGLAVLAVVRHWDKIKAGATAVKDWIVNAFRVVGDKVSSFFGNIRDAATNAKTWIVDKFNAVVDFFEGLPGAITDAFSGVGEGIVSGIKSVWNNTVGGFGFTVPSWVPGVGGKGFHIPELAAGGIIQARPGGSLFIGGEGGEDEVVAPLSKLEAIVRRAMGLRAAAVPAAVGTGRLVIDVTGGENEVVRMVRKWIANNTTGDVQVALGPRR